VEATAHENGEVIAALPLSEAGVAVFPADDACTPIWRELAGTRRVIDFALEAYAVVTATYELRADGARVSMATPAGVVAAQLAVTGVHNVRNALAATACALALGIAPRAITAGLEAFQPVSGRGGRLRTRSGALLIDDSYNANPDSVRAAIDLLAACDRPRMLVLGDMGEVGERGPEFHREIGAYARTRELDALFALGPATRETVSAFGDGAHFDDIESLVAALSGRLEPGATVLVKGSRFMRMERVVQALAEPANENAAAGAH
jgi:UDP-N-acetylmuramoyl-tripeptide--D-alanyl-D-alanine ligase